jgi:hypothetical protein
MGPPNRDVSDQAELFNASVLGEYPGRHATIIDLHVLKSIHDEAIGQETRIPGAVVHLTQGRYFVQEGPYGRALVATLPASELCRLHGEYGDDLFVRNVRLFLGTRAGGVNAGLRDTLDSESERPNFWAYNNGVAIVCDGFSLDGGNHELHLTNFSIVNGCQTTVSLTNAGSAATEAEVLTRFIAAPERMVDNIIFYTNSQTPVRGWELRGQDERQKRLQREMERCPEPWYYTRRRGEIRALSREERARFAGDGKLRAIQHDILGQYLAAFRGLPYVAYKDKGKIFTTHYDAVFPSDLSVEEALLAWRAGEAAGEAVKDALHRAIGNHEELETVILKRGGKLFVVSVMSQILGERNGANYTKHLKRDVVTSKKTLERLGVYAQVAVVWYVRATRQMVGSSGLQQLSSILRTQDSYPQLRKAIEEEWRVQSINRTWVKSLPGL